MKRKAIVLDKLDNVATALMELTKGECVRVEFYPGRKIELLVSVPFGHKLALDDIPLGKPVIKYGETIGLATEDIVRGQHVHVHNVEGVVGRGDKS